MTDNWQECKQADQNDQCTQFTSSMNNLMDGLICTVTGECRAARHDHCQKYEAAVADMKVVSCSDSTQNGATMYIGLRRYLKYEFCKSVECPQLHQNTVYPDSFYCKRRNEGCTKTAKDFHHWLNRNSFNLLKQVD